MITFEEFEKFSKENKEKVIDMIFGVNIPSELERIKKSLGEEGKNPNLHLFFLRTSVLFKETNGLVRITT